MQERSSFFQEHSQTNTQKLDIYEGRQREIQWNACCVPDIGFAAFHTLS